MSKSIFLILILFSTFIVQAATTKISISYPGPGNLIFLPVQLIKKLEIPKKYNVELSEIFVAGGGIAVTNLKTNKVDIAALGMPAVVSALENKLDLTVFANINTSPLFTLMVSQKYKNEINSIAQLKGKIVGVNTSSLSAKTTSQQVLEVLLASAKIKPTDVTIVAGGQSLAAQEKAFEAHGCVAILGDEPFSTLLEEEKKVFVLENLTWPSTQQKIPGAKFMHGVLVARSHDIQTAPEKAKLMVTMLKESLLWISQHSSEEIAKLMYPGFTEREARNNLIKVLKKYPSFYTKNGAFSEKQIEETIRFSANTIDIKTVDVKKSIDSRWVGLEP